MSLPQRLHERFVQFCLSWFMNFMWKLNKPNEIQCKNVAENRFYPVEIRRNRNWPVFRRNFLFQKEFSLCFAFQANAVLFFFFFFSGDAKYCCSRPTFELIGLFSVGLASRSWSMTFLSVTCLHKQAEFKVNHIHFRLVCKLCPNHTLRAKDDHHYTKCKFIVDSMLRERT